MIEGLKVTVGGPELRDLCLERARHHAERSVKYADQIASMKRENLEGMKYTNGDPIQSLKERKAQHDNEEAEIRFIAEHINLDESYLLERTDLHKLGICHSAY